MTFRKYSLDVERNLGLNVAQRYIDPNMGRSPASTRRGITWQDEFQEAGLNCVCADDAAVGRQALNQYLKPDSARWQPRIHVHRRCELTAFQLSRHVWQDRKLGSERALLQVPKDLHDDTCALLKYLMNAKPGFTWLSGMGQVYRRQGKRQGAY